MIKINNIKIPYRAKERLYNKYIAKNLGINENNIRSSKLIRKSLDARKPGNICFVCSFVVDVLNEKQVLKKNKSASIYTDNDYCFEFAKMTSDRPPIIIGSGPAGMFCALMLARAGLCPIVYERGECVEKRRQSVTRFWETGILNTESNVQFGEGGAGTFSDGKLTCGVNDIRMDFVKKEFVKHGAPEDIITNAKPHIGTDYLYTTVKNIRDEIISLGGKVIFDTRMTDIEIADGRVKGVYTENIQTGNISYNECDILVCAIGHSSRDTYEMLYKRGFVMEKKPFSIGFRIEHKRKYINMLQYKQVFEDESLPTADYKLASHPDSRGVYTFCMCPGGVVVASASEENSVVTNGMSDYARMADNSNSAILVSITPEDIENPHPLGGMYFQRELEQKAFELGGRNYNAPCQLLSDFMEGKASIGCLDVKPSYKPEVTYTNIARILPDFAVESLKKAFIDFDSKMKGFICEGAILTGLETRSSAPVKIKRNDDGQSSVMGMFPAGEGAGYAGGIMSSAVDGIKCAENICRLLTQK